MNEWKTKLKGISCSGCIARFAKASTVLVFMAVHGCPVKNPVLIGSYDVQGSNFGSTTWEKPVKLGFFQNPIRLKSVKFCRDFSNRDHGKFCWWRSTHDWCGDPISNRLYFQPCSNLLFITIQKQLREFSRDSRDKISCFFWRIKINHLPFKLSLL